MNTVDNRLFNNAWYKEAIGASKWKQCCWYLVNVLFLMNPLNPSSGLRVFLLRLFGAKIGTGVVVKPGVNIKYPWKLKIGDHSWVGEKVWMDNLADVTIGEHACISQGAMLLTGNHNFKKKEFDLMVQPILVENGAWVGAQALVCPGVTLHSHAVLAVKSVATKNLDAYCIYQGNPALKIKTRVIE